MLRAAAEGTEATVSECIVYYRLIWFNMALIWFDMVLIWF